MEKPIILEPGDSVRSTIDGEEYRVRAIINGFAIVADRTGATATIAVRCLEYIHPSHVEHWPNN